MKMLLDLYILLVGLWIIMGCVPWVHSTDGNGTHLSREDVTLLKDEPNPKCFTRTLDDFTCFFQAPGNKTYHFFYTVARMKRRCKMSVQKTTEETFLHICSFPFMDIHLYVETHLDVVEGTRSLYRRTVSVEDHVLLEPPSQVCVQQNGLVGQLHVSWNFRVPKYFPHVMYLIRYSSEGQVKTARVVKVNLTLESLVPGEEAEVHIAVKCSLTANTGHWSSWSRPQRAVVPQSAGDISLLCVTPDLQRVICQWNGSRYGEETTYTASYTMNVSSAAWTRTQWTECVADSGSTERCSFQGDESRKVRVKLSSPLEPLSRTFYTPEFSLHHSIKTSPPNRLTGVFGENKLCLSWEAPLPVLSNHLQYQVIYQVWAGTAWMILPVNGPESNACVDVPHGRQYSARIRTKPAGALYSGHWSDWSEVLRGATPAEGDLLLLLCVPVFMLLAAIVTIGIFPKYLRKLKRHIWPPVPNLDKVLQGYLTEINGQRWDPPPLAKQSAEETVPSVVEVLSEDEDKPPEASVLLLLPVDRRPTGRQQLDGSPGTDGFPDYVTLSTDFLIQSPKENPYIYECETGGRMAKAESCRERSDFVNRSYVPVAEPADTSDFKSAAGEVSGNLYSNLARS